MMAAAKVRLNFLSPVEREQLARWIEQKAAGLPDKIKEAAALIANDQGGPGLPNQVAYWKSVVAYTKKLAWDVRTERGQRYPPVTAK